MKNKQLASLKDNIYPAKQNKLDDVDPVHVTLMSSVIVSNSQERKGERLE